MIQIYSSIPPFRIWILHIFFSDCPSSQIIFYTVTGKKGSLPRIMAHSNKRAAIPDVCAAARLVPDDCVYVPAGLEAAAFISTPGAAKSGFTTLSVL